MPDRAAALANWAALLAHGGVMLLIEGRFASGNGMAADEVVAAMPGTMSRPNVIDLGRRGALWGGPIQDQRLLVTANRAPEE
jgi:hypothetical protein